MRASRRPSGRRFRRGRDPRRACGTRAERGFASQLFRFELCIYGAVCDTMRRFVVHPQAVGASRKAINGLTALLRTAAAHTIPPNAASRP